MRVLFSAKDKGQTNNQLPRLQRLRACGCAVHGHQRTRLHAKVLIMERRVVVGSCNFATASQSNVECGVALLNLPEAVAIERREWFERLFNATIRLEETSG